MADNVSLRNRLRETSHDLVAQVPQTSGFRMHFLSRNLRCDAEAHDGRDIFRSGAQATLLASAVRDRRQLDSATNVEGADSFRAVHFVGGERDQINRPAFYVDRNFAAG